VSLPCFASAFIVISCLPLHLGDKLGDDSSCSLKCLRAFRKEHFTHKIDVCIHSRFGYGAFASSTTKIHKGDYFGEYIRELLPLSFPRSESLLYRFEIPDICEIVPLLAGNWTRFMNSTCNPNLKPGVETIGKRHIIVFRALRDIGPGEELCFNYRGA
jgi:hypothetical protein